MDRFNLFNFGDQLINSTVASDGYSDDGGVWLVLFSAEAIMIENAQN